MSTYQNQRASGVSCLSVLRVISCNYNGTNGMTARADADADAHGMLLFLALFGRVVFGAA